MAETFDSALLKTIPVLARRPNLIPFYKKAFERISPHILEQEKTIRELFGPALNTYVEKEFEIEIQGTSFIGKIDRVETLSDNSLLVLDYKTGTVDFTPEHIARGQNFQALLYWLGASELFKKEPCAMLFYDLKKGEVKRGLAREDLIRLETKKALTRGHTLGEEKLNSLLKKGVEALIAFSGQIQKGEFAPKPSPESCRFCEASSFCREAVSYA